MTQALLLLLAICGIATKCLSEPIVPQAATFDSRLMQMTMEEKEKEKMRAEQCSFTKNDYSISWREEKGEVYFDLQTKAPKNEKNWWTAVGFGAGHVAGLDVLMTIIENGTIKVFDRKSVSYAGSVIDQHQDVTVYDTSLRDRILRARFSRPLVTNDPEDNPIDKCETWAFPYSGGINTGNWKVVQHFEIPERRRICDVTINCKRLSGDSWIIPTTGAQRREMFNPLPTPAMLNSATYLQHGSAIATSWCFLASLIFIGLIILPKLDCQ